MRKHPFRLETLEPRIMLSADPVDDEFYVDDVMAVEVAQMVPGTPAGGGEQSASQQSAQSLSQAIAVGAHSPFRHNSLLTLTALIATALIIGCSSTEPSNEGESSSSGVLSSSSVIPTYSQGDAPLAKNDQSCEFDEVANLLKCKEKEYKTVKIGELIWMAENLNYGEFISTEDIEPDGYSRFQVGSVKFCYDNDESNCDRYGGLYQWHTAMGLELSCGNRSQFCGDQVSEGHHQGICPKGWHIPSREEALALRDYQYTIAYYGGGHST